MSEGIAVDRSVVGLPRVLLRLRLAGQVGRGGVRSTVAAIVAGIVLSPGLAHAYVDPGSVGFVITTVLGAIAAAGYLIRGWMASFGRWVRGFRKGSRTKCSFAQCDAEPSQGASEDAQTSDDACSGHEDPR